MTRVAEHLRLPGMPRERALAAAFRLLDLGLFWVGGEVYAEENGSHGLATLRKEDVRIANGGRGVRLRGQVRRPPEKVREVAQRVVDNAVLGQGPPTLHHPG